jgi:hypothetical protein
MSARRSDAIAPAWQAPHATGRPGADGSVACGLWVKRARTDHGRRCSARSRAATRPRVWQASQRPSGGAGPPRAGPWQRAPAHAA